MQICTKNVENALKYARKTQIAILYLFIDTQFYDAIQMYYKLTHCNNLAATCSDLYSSGR